MQTTERHAILAKILSLVAHIGVDPHDSADVRLQKLLSVGSILFLAIPPATLVGVILFVFGEPFAAGILFAFSALSLLIAAFLGFKPHLYEFFFFCELLLVLLSPFLTMLALGGFINLNLVIVWSFMCPLGALVMTERKYAQRWFVAFLGLLGSIVVLQPYLRHTNSLPPAVALAVAVLNLGGVSIVTFVLLSYFVAQKNLFQQRADNLLLNILPREIAAILKEESRTIADHFDGVSILFADVVDFTAMSATMTPVELVELLNDVFSYFDTLVEKYGLEKIKTIGDCYMVAAGVPCPRPDHAHILTQMALDIREYVRQREFRGRRLCFRIGLNSGPAVAGVIGRKKFIYDLWGDTVNIASRMESHGIGGTIQVTDATYDLIKEGFICESRGVINVFALTGFPLLLRSFAWGDQLKFFTILCDYLHA